MTVPRFYSLKTTPEIQKQISMLHPVIKEKIKDAVRSIIRDPDIGKPLKNELKWMRSFRTGKFRIVYRVEKSRTVSIIALGPRKTIYGETLRLIGE